jgi:hypothetical protein
MVIDEAAEDGMAVDSLLGSADGETLPQATASPLRALASILLFSAAGISDS